MTTAEEKHRQIEISHAMERAITLTHYDVGRAFKIMFPFQHAYSRTIGRRHYWYIRENPSEEWKVDTEAFALRRRISGPFLRAFEEMRSILFKQIQDSNSVEFQSVATKNVNTITQLINKLKMQGFKNALMIQLKEEYFVQEV